MLTLFALTHVASEPMFSEFIHAMLSPTQRQHLDGLMGWNSMSDAERMRHFVECERMPKGTAARDGKCPVLAPANSAGTFPALLQLQTKTTKPWRSRFSHQSELLTDDQMKDAITRVQAGLLSPVCP